MHCIEHLRVYIYIYIYAGVYVVGGWVCEINFFLRGKSIIDEAFFFFFFVILVFSLPGVGYTYPWQECQHFEVATFDDMLLTKDDNNNNNNKKIFEERTENAQSLWEERKSILCWKTNFFKKK